MNRRNLVVLAALSPVAACAQPTDTNIAMVRNIIEDGRRREAELHTRIVRAYGWLDRYGSALSEEARGAFVLALGPDPGVREIQDTTVVEELKIQ